MAKKKPTKKATSKLNQIADGVTKEEVAKQAELTSEDTDNLVGDAIAKETPLGLPIDPKTGREMPAPREVSANESVPDGDNGPSMMGSTIIPGGTR